MKTNKASISITIFLAGLILFSGCSNLFAPPEQFQENGGLTINVTSGDARNLFPGAPDFTKYVLSFSGGSHADVTIDSGTSKVIEDLEAGTYTITAKGYILLNGTETEAAWGTETITYPQNTTLSIIISADDAATGPVGSFKYSVTFPAAKVDTASLNLTKFSGGAVDGFPVNLKTAPASGHAALAPGYYLLTIELRNAYQKAGHTDIVHIYSGMETELPDYVFAESDFVDFIKLSGALTVTGTKAYNNINIIVYNETGYISQSNGLSPASGVAAPWEIYIAKYPNPGEENLTFSAEIIYPSGPSGHVDQPVSPIDGTVDVSDLNFTVDVGESGDGNGTSIIITGRITTPLLPINEIGGQLGLTDAASFEDLPDHGPEYGSGYIEADGSFSIDVNPGAPETAYLLLMVGSPDQSGAAEGIILVDIYRTPNKISTTANVGNLALGDLQFLETIDMEMGGGGNHGESGGEATPTVVDTDNKTVNGLSYSASAAAGSGTHYRLTGAYDDALAALNARYGTSATTSSITDLQEESTLSTPINWVIFEDRPEQVRLIQDDGSPRSGVEWYKRMTNDPSFNKPLRLQGSFRLTEAGAPPAEVQFAVYINNANLGNSVYRFDREVLHISSDDTNLDDGIGYKTDDGRFYFDLTLKIDGPRTLWFELNDESHFEWAPNSVDITAGDITDGFKTGIDAGTINH